MVSEAQREIAKWLNEDSTAPINRKALATMACELHAAQRDAARYRFLRDKCTRTWFEQANGHNQYGGLHWDKYHEWKFAALAIYTTLDEAVDAGMKVDAAIDEAMGKR